MSKHNDNKDNQSPRQPAPAHEQLDRQQWIARALAAAARHQSEENKNRS